MSTKRKRSPPRPARTSANPHPHRTQPDPLTGISLNQTHGRDGLLPYITSPASFPAQRVLRYNDAFVTIRDLYPKSTVHLLLLPRDPALYRQHPFDALADPSFLAAVRTQVTELTALVASELRRLFGADSAADAARNAALDADEPPPDLPPGRDWGSEVMAGVHASPSMNHMHVHVLSRDRWSGALKHRKHYNSFSTGFFVPVGDFPLEGADPRRAPGQEGYLGRELVCWRCGWNFGKRFAELRAPLGVEFAAWRRE